MRVRYTSRAFANREATFDFIEKRSPQSARKVIRFISERIAGLADHPYSGTKTNKAGIYTVWISPYPYRVFYRVEGEEVVILHIRHTPRRPL